MVGCPPLSHNLRKNEEKGFPLQRCFPLGIRIFPENLRASEARRGKTAPVLGNKDGEQWRNQPLSTCGYFNQKAPWPVARAICFLKPPRPVFPPWAQNQRLSIEDDEVANSGPQSPGPDPIRAVARPGRGRNRRKSGCGSNVGVQNGKPGKWSHGLKPAVFWVV